MKLKLLLGLLVCSVSMYAQCASATRFLVAGGDGVFADSNNWSTSSGGSSGASAPNTGTIACMDANSGATTITLGANTASLGSLDMTNFTGTFAFSTFHFSWEGLGPLIFGTGMTVTYSTGAQINATATSGSSTFTPNNIVLPLFAQGSSASTATTLLGSNFGGCTSLDMVAGTFDANGYNVTCVSTTEGNTTTKTLYMRSGVWTLTGTGIVWGFTSTTDNLTIVPGTSSIVISDTSSTQKEFADRTGTSYAGISFTLPTGTGGTYFAPNAAETLGTVTVAPGGLITLQSMVSSGTFTMTPVFTGTSGNNITIKNETASDLAEIAVPGVTCLSYVTIPNTTSGYITFTGATVYAQNSTIGANAMGITASACPAASAGQVGAFLVGP